MKKLLLIPCGKEKLSERTIASELYIGSYFKAGLNFAINNGLKFKILSAKYGILEPTDLIEPYDLHMKDTGEDYRLKWAYSIKETLNEYDSYSICGAEYELPLLRVGCKLKILLNGLTQGFRLKALNSGLSLITLPGQVDSSRINEGVERVKKLALISPCRKIRFLVRNTDYASNEILLIGSLLGIDHKTIKAQIFRTRHGLVK